MELHLVGKVAVISGGATGIGKAAAIEYMKEGVQVAVFGRRLSVLEAFASEAAQMGYSVYYEAVDVADKEQVQAFADHVYEKFGHIDIWVNNAGISIDKELMEFTDADWELINKINVDGVYNGIRIAAGYMKKQNSGVIINASSYAALIPHANGVIYAASKASVSSLTRSTGAALAPYGIRVVGYIPGMIQTGISEEFIAQYHDKFIKDISSGRLGVPEDLAKPIVFLSSDAAGYITACDIQITGGKFAVQDCAMPWRMKEEKEGYRKV